MTKTKKQRALLAAAFGGLSVVPFSYAATTSTWQASTSDWIVPANWSGAVPTSTAVNATIDNGGTAQITQSGPRAGTIELGSLAGASGTISASVGAASLTGTTINIGDAGTGTLNLASGSVQITNVNVGVQNGSSGAINLSGGTLIGTTILGTAANTTGSAVLAQTGGTLSGNLTINPNSSYSISGGSYQGAITYAGGQFGASGSAVLKISGFSQSAGSVVAGSAGGFFPADPITLSSTGLTNYFLSGGSLTTSAITVGSGTRLNLTGGDLNTQTVNLAGGTIQAEFVDFDDGSPRIRQNNSNGGIEPTLNVNGGSIVTEGSGVGDLHAGTFNYTQSSNLVTQGLALNLAGADDATATYTLPTGQNVSEFAEEIGHLSVDSNSVVHQGLGHFVQTGGSNKGGSVSISNGSYFISGGNYSGTTDISNGSFTQTGGTASHNNMTIGETASSSYTLSGGTFKAINVTVGNTAAGSFSESDGDATGTALLIGNAANPSGVGTFDLTGGTLSFATLQTVSGSTFRIQHDSATFSGAATNAGDISLLPGDASGSAGNLSVNSYNQTGELDIGIGGPAANSGFSVVSVTTSATLGGSLVITTSDGYTPYFGETFQVITSASEAGTFSSVSSTNGQQYTASYSANGVTLTAVPEPVATALLITVASLTAARRRTMVG